MGFFYDIYTAISSIGLRNTLALTSGKLNHTFQEKYKYYFSIQPKLIKSKDSYTINYDYNGTDYKILLKINKKRKPNILHAFSQNNEDVLDQIIPYLGPFNDFHHIKYTPLDLGFNELRFVLLGNVEKKFSSSQEINLRD